MYAGKIVEIADSDTIFEAPVHPYTQGLLQTVPDKSNPDQPLFSIKGNVPTLLEPQTCCRFAPRCEYVLERCRQELPPLYDLDGDHQAACFLHDSRGKV